jgi:hypothetical protein
MEEPFERDTPADAHTGFLVGLLDLDAGDRLEEEEVGLVVHEHEDVVVSLAELRGHRVLGRGRCSCLFFFRQDAGQGSVEARVVELLQEVLEHLTVLVRQLGNVVVCEEMGQLVGLGGEVLDITRHLGEPELQGSLAPGVTRHDEAGQARNHDGCTPPLVFQDPGQHFDLFRGMPVRVLGVRSQVGDRHHLGEGAVNFHGTFSFRFRRTKGGLLEDLLTSSAQKTPSIINRRSAASVCAAIPGAGSGLPARLIRPGWQDRPEDDPAEESEVPRDADGHGRELREVRRSDGDSADELDRRGENTDLYSVRANDRHQAEAQRLARWLAARSEGPTLADEGQREDDRG